MAWKKDPVAALAETGSGVIVPLVDAALASVAPAAEALEQAVGSRRQPRTPRVFLAALSIAALGMAVIGAVALLNREQVTATLGDLRDDVTPAGPQPGPDLADDETDSASWGNAVADQPLA